MDVALELEHPHRSRPHGNAPQPDRDQPGYQPSVVGDAEFLAGLNPGKVSRCVLT